MEILRYALGIRFDTRKFPYGDSMYHAFQLLCSVLSFSELSQIMIHGGYPYDEEPYVYLVVLECDEYKPLKKIFELLNKNSALPLFLCDELPYVEKNRLIQIKNIESYGRYDEIYLKLPNAPKMVYDVKPSGKRSDMKGRGYRFMFAPDSFKGTIKAEDAIRLLTLAACESHYRGCEVIPMPMADGGEGTLDALCPTLGARRVKVKVHDPLGNIIDAEYAVTLGNTAIIEMAKASGLTLIPKDKRDVKRASSQGTGELIMHAINSGIRKVVVAVGGSATNDGGTGCANAMGVKFLNKFGGEVTPCGGELIDINSIDTSYVSAAVRETEFTVMCDVENPLTGLNGATMVYSEQKGADAKAMFQLECGMKNYRRHLNNIAGYDVCKSKGAGAAGGMGAMLMAIFNAKMCKGIDTVLNLADFDSKLKKLSLIVTGEGCFDKQTMSGGKAVSGIVKRAKGKVPVAIICGCTKDNVRSMLTETGVIPITHSFIDECVASQRAYELFYDAAVNMFTVLKSGSKMKRK